MQRLSLSLSLLAAIIAVAAGGEAYQQREKAVEGRAEAKLAGLIGQSYAVMLTDPYALPYIEGVTVWKAEADDLEQPLTVRSYLPAVYYNGEWHGFSQIALCATIQITTTEIQVLILCRLPMTSPSLGERMAIWTLNGSLETNCSGNVLKVAGYQDSRYSEILPFPNGTSPCDINFDGATATQ